MRKINKGFKHNNSIFMCRSLKKIGKRNCNLCNKRFDISSKFDRFCLSCKHRSEIYRGCYV